MSTTTTLKNPLEALLHQKQEEEAIERAQAEEAAERNRAEREAAEMQRRAAAKLQYLRNEVEDFAHGFLSAIAKHAMGDKQKRRPAWTAAAIAQAQAYANALLCNKDRELPIIDPGIRKVVQDKFAYGMALKHEHMPNVMAQNYFLGMRQEWFEEAFDKATESYANSRRRR